MRVACVGLGLGCVATSCTSDLELNLSGKECTSKGECVSGYWCDREANVCLPLGRLPVGGRGGSSSLDGDAGDGNHGVGGAHGGAAGAGSLAGSGGGSGAGASGGASNGGSGVGGVGGAAGQNDPDGGSNEAPDADGGCVPATVYHDIDGDTFGDSSDSRIACVSAGWVLVGGDCRDDQPLVFPGQPSYFSVGYPAPGGVSFDYDCSNDEEPDPDNDTNDGVPDCSTLLGLGLGCSGRGFQPATPARSGVGIEPRCGSNVRTTCVLDGTCNAVDDTLADSARFRCK